MDRQTRRNFFSKCIAAGAVLLTGSLPKDDFVPGCCALKPFKSEQIRICNLHLDGFHKPIPLEWDDKNNQWAIAKNAKSIMIGKNEYKIVRVDSDGGSISFTTTYTDGVIDDNVTCPVLGKDLRELIGFQKFTEECNEDMPYKFVIIDNNNDHGFLATCRPAWNFRKCDA